MSDTMHRDGTGEDPVDDLFFEELARRTAPEDAPEPAPSRLKSRIFSRLNLEQAQDGPLLGFSECKKNGGKLCVFEELVRIAPVGERAKQANICRVCHARLLGENVEPAPIWWPGCPYVRFQNR